MVVTYGRGSIGNAPQCSTAPSVRHATNHQIQSPIIASAPASRHRPDVGQGTNTLLSISYAAIRVIRFVLNDARWQQKMQKCPLFRSRFCPRNSFSFLFIVCARARSPAEFLVLPSRAGAGAGDAEPHRSAAPLTSRNFFPVFSREGGRERQSHISARPTTVAFLNP